MNSYVNTNNPNRIAITEIENGNIVYFDDNITSLIVDIAVTNDGRTVVAYSDSIKVYDFRGGIIREISTRAGTRYPCIALHPVDSTLMAVGNSSADGLVQLYNLDTGVPVGSEWRADNDDVDALEFNRGDGSRLMTYNSLDNIVRVWDPMSGTQIGPEHEGYLPSISFDGKKLAFSDYKDIQIVDVESGNTLVPKISYPHGSPYNVSFEPEGNEIVVSYRCTPSILCTRIGESQSDIIRWSTNNGEQVGNTFEGQEYGGPNITMNVWPSNASNNLFVSISEPSRWVLVWDRTTSRIVRRIMLPSNNKADLTRISPDGRYLVVTEQKLFKADSHRKNRLLHRQYSMEKKPHRLVSTKLADVTNDLLSNAFHPAPVCAAFSEQSLADGIALGLNTKIGGRYPVSSIQGMFFAINPSHTSQVEVFADQNLRKIRVNLPLYLDLYQDQNELSQRISRTRVSFTILAEPSMVTVRSDVAQRFQLNFEGSALDSKIDTFIIDPTLVLGIFGTNEKFVTFIEKTIDNMLLSTGEGISLYLSALVIDASMPDSWNRAREYELIFRGFDFHSVQVQTSTAMEEVGYIFMMFSLVSHNFPPPCICREDTKSFSTNALDIPRDPRRYFSLGFSEEALNVLATPHRHSGDRRGKTEGVELFWEVDQYFKTEIGTIDIVPGGLEAPVSVAGGGSLTAGMKEGIFHNEIIRETVGLHMSVRDVKTKWDVAVLNDYPNKGVTSIVLVPRVIIDPKKIDVELETPLPRRVDRVVSAVVDWFITVVILLIVEAIKWVGHMELVFDLYNNEGKSFFLLDAQSSVFENSSIVLMAEVSVCLPQ
ncbi:WD40 repeat domain-containing protein [Priestia endophytica]|uniref:WD40 repeat domain-containing protein n=1 Tax=Priestia endophytica TaxID=135735 RepID=UPI00124C66FF|nr:WD40 repeat domain-containing protein [Priestia endophytica]KAB2489632.1 WD40 repeat domain-containing protein [Priestia endophytica]